MKSLLLLLCMCFTGMSLSAQHNNPSPITNYLIGAVPTVNGQVVFSESRSVSGLTQAQIFDRLKSYVAEKMVKGADAVPPSRITEASPEEGILAASIVENLWFKRTALVADAAQFHYQIVFKISNGHYEAMLRHLRYLYEPMSTPGMDNMLPAEEWITDREALNKQGTRLTRVAGRKFRVKTIDRKDAIFRGAAQACGLPQ